MNARHVLETALAGLSARQDRTTRFIKPGNIEILKTQNNVHQQFAVYSIRLL